MSAIEADNIPRPDRQSGLQRHQRLKLELAAIIRSGMRLFHEAGDESREIETRRLLSRIAEDRFNLVVVGQFKRGKSSLMNAVIGMDRLPTGVLPLTSVVTAVRYGERERVLIRRRGWSMAEEIPLARLEEYVTERGNPGNRQQVDLAEVLLPSEVLRLGFHFIDTPGVGSAIAANTAATRRFLPEADAVIFVTSFESTMNEGELAFLRTVGRHVQKIFFVVNKADLVSAADRQAVLSSVGETISGELGMAEPRLFAVSARQGLEAKLAGDQEMLARSGLPELESALTHFLTSERAHVSLTRCIDRASALLLPDRFARSLGELCARIGKEALESLKREWEGRMRQVQAECESAVETLHRRIRTELPSRFGPAIAAHCTEFRDRLSFELSLLLEGGEKIVTAEDLRRLADRAQELAGESLQLWVGAHRKPFEEELWALAAEGVEQLETLYVRALGFAAELFRFPPPAASWGVSRDEAAFSWKSVTPFEWRPRTAWELDILHAKWVRKRVRREYGRTLETAAVAYRDRVTRDLGESGSEWGGRLCSEAKAALKNLGAQVTVAMEGQSPSAISEEAGALLKRLDAMREELEGKGRNRTILEALAPVGGRRPIRPCFACERIAAELYDFFRKRQYELSVNEAEQRVHAANGGFCLLHTWQYEHIASPQGICLAYAPLLAATARHLRLIAASALSPQSMMDRILDLCPSGDRCPACRRMLEAEKAAVEQFRQMSRNRDDEEEAAGLCVRHLGAVLNRETDIETAKNMVFEQAKTLERISEDMQTYSLKRDATRADLISDEEWKVHLLGLSLLVGHRRLSAPS